MKVIKSIALGLIIVLLVSTLMACSGEKNQFVGDWAYIHDQENTVLSFKSNTKVVFENVTYKYTFDDTFINLKADNGEELKLRYEMEGEHKFLLYKTTVYDYQGEGEATGLVGVWKNEANKWEFEFTASGEFKEDGYFPGLYTEDTGNSVKLVYNDHFPDATLYYSIENNQLSVEYPWTMVTTGTDGK